jgi:hypothetical protein
MVTIYPSAQHNSPDGTNLQQDHCDNLKSCTVALLGKHLMPEVITVSLTSQKIGYIILRDTVALMLMMFEVICMLLSIKMWSSGMLYCVKWSVGATVLEEPHLRTEE